MQKGPSPRAWQEPNLVSAAFPQNAMAFRGNKDHKGSSFCDVCDDVMKGGQKFVQQFSIRFVATSLN